MSATRPSPLRLAPDADAPSLTFDEAQGAFQSHYRAARAECVEALADFGGYLIRGLLISHDPVSMSRLRATRDAAQQVANHALAMVSELNKALDACERVGGVRS